MVRIVRPYGQYVALLALVVGLALLVDALVRGSAQASIIVIVPVLSGSSPEFVVGTLLTFVGLFGMFLSSAGVTTVDEPVPGRTESRSGGVVLIGPVPIFFGEWRRTGRHGFWGWVAAGSIATALLVLLFVWLWIRG
jgi:uncharacterized membrane protein